MSSYQIEIEAPKPLLAKRLFLLVASIVLFLGLLQFRDQITAEGLIETSRNFRWALNAGYVFLGVLLVLLLLSLSPYWATLQKRFASIFNRISIPHTLAFSLLPLGAAAYLFLTFGFYGRFLLGTYSRWAIFLAFALFIAWALSQYAKKGFWSSFAIASLALAFFHNAAIFLQQVSNYPLSLDWSEISRYYQASFYYSEKVYGLDLALPITHPSRYLLQSLPFLIEASPLWLHRLWQALLWISMASLTSWAFLRRFKITGSRLAIALFLYIYLFLMQGAVFYHLLPCVIIVLLTFDPRRFGRSLAFVLLASIWAGISRVNWVPLPGALAALIFLFEESVPEGQSPFSLRYWLHPAIYFLGGSLTALGAYTLYIQNSGVADAGQFASSFTSDLLWQRLWPASAFPLGILPGILLVSLPLLWIIYQRRSFIGALSVLRRTAIMLILLVFFVGGLVVSVKIGGGTNLHNMDAFMVLLLTFTLLLFVRGSRIEGETTAPLMKLHWGQALLLLAIPIYFSISSGGPREQPDEEVVEAALELIQEQVDDYVGRGMEVLFISQRHLITFRSIEAPLVHDYEKLFLMEMAISHNDPYLVRFQDEIDNWRFGLIVTDPLHRLIREEDQDSLAAENNEWVRSVARPILCAYRPLQTYPELALELLVPRFGGKCNQ